MVKRLATFRDRSKKKGIGLSGDAGPYLVWDERSRFKWSNNVYYNLFSLSMADLQPIRLKLFLIFNLSHSPLL